MVNYLAEEYGHVLVRSTIDKSTFPPNQLVLGSCCSSDMDDERIARGLNLLGENADLFSSDRDGLLDLIEDYFDDHATEGKLRPSLLSHPTINAHTHEYSHQLKRNATQ